MNNVENYLRPEDPACLKEFVTSGNIDRYYNQKGTGFDPERLKINLLGFMRHVLNGSITEAKQLNPVNICHPINLVNDQNVNEIIKKSMSPLVY